MTASQFVAGRGVKGERRPELIAGIALTRTVPRYDREMRAGEWTRDVDFWKKLDEDLARRRRMRTPMLVESRS